MVIHLSILLVILLVCLFAERSNRRFALECIEEGNWFIHPRTPWVIILGYIAFLAAMRTGTNDTSAYIQSFNHLPATWEAFRKQVASAELGTDWAFDAISILFKILVSDDYHLWMGMYAAVEAMAFVYVLRRNAVSIFDCCFYLFCSTLYYNNFSMMRQWFAVTMIFAASHYIAEGKFWRYALVCLLVGQCHSSALLMIPMYFIVRGNAWSQKQMLLILAFAVGMIFLDPIMSSMEATLSGTTYDYAISAMASGSGSSIIRALIAVVPVALAYIYRVDSENPMINLSVNMSLINFMLNLLASFTSGLYIIRFATYTAVFNLILYPYLLNVSVREHQRVIKPLYYIIYLAFYFYQMNYQGSFYYGSDILGKFY